MSLLYGVKRIARHLDLSPRQVGYMIQQGRLPVVKMGSIWASTPDMLDEHFRELRRKSVEDSS